MSASIPYPPYLGTATVAPGGGAGIFVVSYVAPATAQPGDGDDVSVEVTDDSAYPYPYSALIHIALNVPIPPPRCYPTDDVYAPAGEPVQIYPACETYDGNLATIELVTPPQHGTLHDDGNGLWSYTAPTSFRGIDQVTFRARDANGVSEPLVQRIQVDAPIPKFLKPSRSTLDLCAPRHAGEQCGPGYGRRTRGGGEKVSHRHWPRITGILWKVFDAGAHAHTGGKDDDELLGHHGNDTIDGGGGTDVIWGDWDPYDNNTTQVDVLAGGAGNDFIYTSHGTNTVRGGPGADHIWAFYGHGTIDCGPGTDVVRLRGGSKAYKLKSCERRGSF
jgi:Ca2+-binding RTX toxin-like protein